MTKVLSIGTDRDVFKEGEARTRQIEYGKLFDELHIIVFSRRKFVLKPQKISENTWIYPTNSFSKFTYVFDAKKIGKKILNNDKKSDWTITSQDPFETGLVARHLSSIYNSRLNIQIHTDFLNKNYKNFSLLSIIRVSRAVKLLETANSIRVVSEKIKNSLPALSHRISVLPMFIDIKKISEEESLFNLHDKFPEFNFIILSVARLEFEKNIYFAIRVFAEVLKKFPKTGFVIVGDGRDRLKLEGQVKKIGIADNVKFEGYQENAIGYYKNADLYLNTSFIEGYSRSLIEAAASKIPIMSTPVGPIGEVLIPGRDVLICGQKDKNCFVEKIEKLISDRNFRKSLSENAFNAVKVKAITKQEYLDCYQKAIIGN